MRAAALAVLLTVLFWVLTGVRLVGPDEGEGKARAGLFRRILLGAIAAGVLGALAADPAAALDTVAGWSSSLADQLSS